MPDAWKDYPHHKSKEEEILSRIYKARNLYLENDNECYAELGYALHYIADKWTLNLHTVEEHADWERAIENEEIIIDDKILKNRILDASIPDKVIKEYLINLKINKDNYIIYYEDFESVLFNYIIRLSNMFMAWYENNKNLVPISERVLIKSIIERIFEKYLQTSNHKEIYNYLYDVFVKGAYINPIFEGYQALVFKLMLDTRASNWSVPFIDINMAYKYSLLISKLTLINNSDDLIWNTPRKLDDNNIYSDGIKYINDDIMLFMIEINKNMIKKEEEKNTIYEKRIKEYENKYSAAFSVPSNTSIVKHQVSSFYNMFPWVAQLDSNRREALYDTYNVIFDIEKDKYEKLTKKL